jgi:ribosomal protein S18 acetylase RimI-like enzyme
MVKQIFYGTPEYESAFQLRDIVLRKPWGRSFKDDDLSKEQKGIDTNWGYFQDGTLVCVGTLTPVSNDIIKIRYLATHPSVQGKGFGKAVLSAMEEFARSQNYTQMILESRVSAQEFYRKYGYQTEGEAYYPEFIHIPHIKMFKIL